MRLCADTCFLSSMEGKILYYDMLWSAACYDWYTIISLIINNDVIVCFCPYRTTMHTEYTILNAIHCDAAEQSLHAAGFQYHHFRMGWYSFITLLDIDFSEGFYCEQCGSSPNAVIMDGTAVSFRKALDSWSSLQLDSTTESKARPGR